jgi:anti-anti-sigma regulatory factor
MPVKEVKLLQLFKTDTLRHRETARTVIEDLEKEKTEKRIVIDFSGISFASRSFCHELRRGLNGRDVVFLNMLPEVEEMMSIAFTKPQVKLIISSEPQRLEKLVSG